MSYIAKETLTIPLRDKLIDNTGETSNSWTSFFRAVYERLLPLGSEKYFDFVGSTEVQDLVGMRFNKDNETHVITELLIQRISKGTGSVEKIGSVVLHAFYLPLQTDIKTPTWSIEVGETRGSSMGFTFSILPNGQVQFISGVITGTVKVEKLTWRSRTKAAKIAPAILGQTI